MAQRTITLASIEDVNALEASKGNKPLWVDMGTISNLPVTKTATGVTTDMIVSEAVLGTPEVQTSDWIINTDTANSITVSGTISGTTTLKILLTPQNAITAT